MPHGMVSRISYISYDIDRVRLRGGHSGFFHKAGASDENVCSPTTGLVKARKRSSVPGGTALFPFVSERADCRYANACLGFFTQVSGDLTA